MEGVSDRPDGAMGRRCDCARCPRGGTLVRGRSVDRPCEPLIAGIAATAAALSRCEKAHIGWRSSVPASGSVTGSSSRAPSPPTGDPGGVSESKALRPRPSFAGLVFSPLGSFNGVESA